MGVDKECSHWPDDARVMRWQLRRRCRPWRLAELEALSTLSRDGRKLDHVVHPELGGSSWGIQSEPGPASHVPPASQHDALAGARCKREFELQSHAVTCCCWI